MRVRSTHRIHRRPALGALSLAILCMTVSVPTAARISTPYSPTSTVELSPGISYGMGTMRTGRKAFIQSVRVATVQPDHPAVRLRSLLSNDLVVARERVTRLAQRLSGPGMVAMVATDGDMSTEGRVDAYAAPQSMAVSGGELLVAQACTRPTLGIDRSGRARIDDVRVHVTMRPAPSSQTMSGPPGRVVARRIHRVNTHRDDAGTVLFTSRFASTTQTAPGGLEVILSLPDVLRPSGLQEVQVLEVRPGAGDTPLGSGMAVLSVRDPAGSLGRATAAGSTDAPEDHDRAPGRQAVPGHGRGCPGMGRHHRGARGQPLHAPERCTGRPQPIGLRRVGAARTPHQRGGHG